MLKFCRDAWDKNKDKLKAEIMLDEHINECEYVYLVELIVKHILNPALKEADCCEFDFDEITVIDNGDYQGTLLFMIPEKTYQPDANDYLLTYAYYGSCSGCDTLQRIQGFKFDGFPTESQVNDYMLLCKGLVCNIVKPYNFGWGANELFTEIAEV